MQINNWLKIIVGVIFFPMIIIAIPVGIYLIKKGIDGFLKYKFSKLPKTFTLAYDIGHYAIEIIIYGLMISIGSVWFLFFYEGGQLKSFISQAMLFLTTNV